MEILEKNDNYIIKKIPGFKENFFYICEISNFNFYEKLRKEIQKNNCFIITIKKFGEKIYIIYKIGFFNFRIKYFFEKNEVSHIFFNSEIEKICKKNF